MEYFVGGVFATILTAIVFQLLKWALEDFIQRVISGYMKSNPGVKKWEIYDEIRKHEAEKHKSKRRK